MTMRPSAPRPTDRPHAHRGVVLLLAVALAGCGTTTVGASLGGGAGAPVAATGLDPLVLLDMLPDDVAPGWQRSDGGNAVAVGLDEVELADSTRARRYAEAGFEAGARLSFARGDQDRLAIMVDRFPHPAAAHQVEDWHLSSTGTTLVDGVSQVGTTAEGVLVIEDLLVRVVAVGTGAPDTDAVRGVLDAIRSAALPTS